MSQVPVTPVGEVAFGDMHTAFGYQVQPAAAYTDYLYTQSGSSLQGAAGCTIDPLHECVYATEVMVWHDQRSDVAKLKDKNAYRRTGSPCVVWDTLQIDGTKAEASASAQNFPDGYFGHQYIDVHGQDDASADQNSLLASTAWWEDADGTPRALNAQRVRLYYSRSLFPTLAAASDPAANPTLAASFQIGGYWYRVDLSATSAPRIARSQDAQGETGYTAVRSEVAGGSSHAQHTGATGNARKGEMDEVCVTVLGGKVSVSHGAGGVPVLIPHARMTRTGVVALAPGTLYVAPGTARNLPPAPFECQLFDGNPSPDRVVNVLVTAVDTANDALTLGSGAGEARPGWTLDILDPRITGVRIEARGFSQCSFELHPAKWTPSWTWVSPVRQLGFAPQPAAPAGVGIGIANPIHYTVHTTAEAGAAGTLTSTDFTAQSPLGATVHIDTTLQGTAAYYTATATNPASKGATDSGPGSGFNAYQGAQYADETLALTRITLRVDGYEETPATAYVNAPIGFSVGGGVENVVQEVSESSVFDPGAMTIRRTATVVLNNHYGVDTLSRVTGVGAFGNVAVALRMGYPSQSGGFPGDGGVGFPRFFGFSPDREFPTAPGGAIAKMVLRCCDQTQQLTETLIAAPPDLDLYNHYYAMAFLAQMAGIPLRRMAFAPLVPDEPYGVSPFDDAPYFLPAGPGMSPWTPINRTLSTIQLMEYVRKTTGFLLYFDAWGLLHYEPWQPLTTFGYGPKRIFQPTPADGFGNVDSDGGYVDCHSLQVHTSVADVRNQTVLVGIDAMDGWEPIVVKYEDGASITSAPGAQPANYKGYKAPLVILDSRFANFGFATRAAYNIFRWVRQPTIEVSFTTWVQGDLYPLDLIYVNDWRSGIAGMPLYVMSVTNTISVLAQGKAIQQAQVTARYLDPTTLVL